ncbi:glycosyltransferase family 39 protein [Sphaerospermopsis aphanizomenoides BCCUSP55]|uniref:ArnT family glycosyltransferase n=1 Tax=Sphaerospermopsis aphanizomenoides TaxID=459663 RepID=UPI001907B856|nr:glycosyltransferase family 39 protein [Sphaerospermopsis aphanizomenoides]MBK1986728.1 glycosyltransferase family 39 protein [Sphaerospermopsis aphanizomenoides BCCUSP55]
MRLKLSVTRPVDQWLNNIEQRPALAVTIAIVWLLLINFIAFGWNLGNIGLIDETEPLFAEASRQMLVTGDWITPFFNGVTRFDKPALIYWCQAIAYSIMGVNEWAARIPSALAATGVTALAFYAVQWHFAKKDELEQTANPTRRYLTAAVASALMALNPEMIVWGRVGVSDMLLTGCIASALLCFFLGYAQNSAPSRFPNQWYLACYVLMAGAILTKGPVGIVLPGLIMIAFALYVGKFWQLWREMRPILGLGIVFVISAPWYILVTWRNGWNFINAFFGYHNIERFTEVVNGHSAPWYFYFLVVLFGFAPYSVYIPGAIARLKFWQRSQIINQERSQQLGLFACFWFLGVFSFFTIAVTKLPSYVLPLMPAAAILVALWWSDLFPNTHTHKSFSISGWVNVAFLSALAVALFNISHIIGTDPAAPELYEQIQNLGIANIGGIIWLTAAVIIAVLILTYRWRAIITINLICFVAFLSLVLMPALFLMDAERQAPLRQLSAIAVQEQQPNEELVMVGFKKPTVTFYTQKTVTYLRFSQEALDHIRTQASAKVQPPSLLLLAEQKKFVEMDLPPDHYKAIATKGAYNLIRVPFQRINQNKKEKTDNS